MSLYEGDMSSRIMAGEKMEDVLKNPDAPKINWAELGKGIYNQGFPNTYNVTSTPVLCKDGTTKNQLSSETGKYADACRDNGGRADNQPVLPLSVTDPELFKKNMELSAKKDEKMKQLKYGVIAVVLVAGYFAYKKFKK